MGLILTDSEKITVKESLLISYTTKCEQIKEVKTIFRNTWNRRRDLLYASVVRKINMMLGPDTTMTLKPSVLVNSKIRNPIHLTFFKRGLKHGRYARINESMNPCVLHN